MKLLAIDTSSLACTVGVLCGETIATRYEERAREHTQLLMPMIRETLSETALTVKDLDGIVLGNGPGSFIGMRIAASVAQGLAHGADIPIVPVSSLAAVAWSAGEPGEQVAVTQDAHMNEVYLGIYQLDDSGGIEPLGDEILHGQDAIAGLASGAVAAGAGWSRWPALLEANRSRIGRMSDCLYPRGEALLAIGKSSYASGDTVAPEAVEPAYLRQKVAEKPGA